MTKPFRIAVVNSHPIQYFAPLYDYLNQDPELEVTALYCSDASLRGGVDPGFGQVVVWDVDLLAGGRVTWLGDRAKARVPGGFWSLVCPELWSEIRRDRYDAVILHGYAYAAYVLAFLAAKSRGIPVLVRSETHLGLRRSTFKSRLRDPILRCAYRLVDGFLAIGSANRIYYRSLGVSEKKIYDVPYTVDNERFIAASLLTEGQRDEVRRRFDLPTGLPVVVYASKLARRKHPDDVVRAMKLLQDEGVQGALLIVGTGEMESELRELVSATALRNVAFGGFVNQRDMPRVLAAADVFVLPAENEPWGLIVNEAMCAGLPVVVGRAVGCVPDLVHEGKNGHLATPGDTESLANALRPLLRSEPLRKRMGASSRTLIGEWSYERCRAGIRASCAAEVRR